MNRMKIAEKLKNLRLAKGISTYELAKLLDISPSAVSMYECGERIPRDDVKLKFAKFYNVSVESIFFG